MNALTKQQLEVAKAVIAAIGSAEEYKVWAYYNERSDPSKFRSYESVFDNNLIVLSELFALFLIDYEKAYYIAEMPLSLLLLTLYGRRVGLTKLQRLKTTKSNSKVLVLRVVGIATIS